MPPKHKRIVRCRKEIILAVFLCGLGIAWSIVAIIVVHGTSNAEQSSRSPFSQQRSLDKLPDRTPPSLQDGAPPVIGQHTVLSVDDRQTEVVYALPPNTIHGIALLLHGCSHNALKFFSPSPACETCIGLSEELRIARILLEQNTLAVIAVTSQDRKSGCWSNRDILHIQDVLDHFQTPQSTTGARVLAFGASSGGRFAAQLAVRKMVDAAMVGVMSLGDQLVQKWNAMPDQKPPIYLAPMPRDQNTLHGNQNDFAAMAGKGPVILDVTTCVAMPVTAEFLNQRVPHMTLSMAKLIIPALVASGHLDPNTSILLKDPTRSDWRVILQNQCGAQGCLQNQPLGPGVSPLAKALHRCWAFHEYCSEVTVKTLQFFQKELGGSELVGSKT